jgi:hypothetical protein
MHEQSDSMCRRIDNFSIAIEPRIAACTRVGCGQWRQPARWRRRAVIIPMHASKAGEGVTDTACEAAAFAVAGPRG